MIVMYALLAVIYICGLFVLLVLGGMNSAKTTLKEVIMWLCWPLTLVGFVLYLILVAIKNGLKG